MKVVLVHASMSDGRRFVGLAEDGRVLPLEYCLNQGTLETEPSGLDPSAIHHRWSAWASALRAACESDLLRQAIAREGIFLDTLRLHAPVAPRQVFCTIGNYASQLIEAALDKGAGPNGADASARRDAALTAVHVRRTTGAPYICLKPCSSVSDPVGTLALDAGHTTLDWEVELGVVIGSARPNMTRGQAAAAIAGYCLVNDITLRSAVFREDPPHFGTDWIQSKGGPGWLPAGPYFVPHWSVPDPGSLRLWLRLNGTLMQDGCTGDMVFGIAEQIAYLSRHVALLPGDLICTGSPAGFGSHHGRFLQPGDLLEAGIDGFGSQRIRCTDSSLSPSKQ